MRYNFPVPKSRGIPKSQNVPGNNPPVITNDVFLHLLFGRIAASDNNTHELNTNYDNDTLSLDIPDEFLSLIEDIKKDPKLQRFVNWLVAGLSSDLVFYDNTDSGLNSTNVKDAIDELKSGSGGGDPVLGGDLGGVASDGHVKTVRGVSKTPTYDGEGRLATVTSSLGTQTFVYDGDGRLTNIIGTGRYPSKTISYSGGLWAGTAVT